MFDWEGNPHWGRIKCLIDNFLQKILLSQKERNTYIYLFIDNIKRDDTCFRLEIQGWNGIQTDWCGFLDKQAWEGSLPEEEKLPLEFMEWKSKSKIIFQTWSFGFRVKLVLLSCGQKQDWWAKVSGSKRCGRPKIYFFSAGERIKVCHKLGDWFFSQTRVIP